MPVSVTFTTNVPTLFSTTQVTIVLPYVRPVITPVAEIVAMDSSLLCQPNVRDVLGNAVPELLRKSAATLVLRPTCAALGNVRTTRATGTKDTVMFNMPVFPPEAAVMVVVPAVNAVINPDVDTEATVGALDVQVVMNDVKALLLASRAVDVACNVSPTKNDVGTVAVTVTVATVGSTTNTGIVVLLPSTEATIFAVPLVTPVTVAVVVPAVATAVTTVATVVLFDIHVTVLPVMTESR